MFLYTFITKKLTRRTGRLAVVFSCLPIILLSAFIPDAYAAAKVALVIGNANYQSIPLDNPKNDAVDMSEALKALGFDVDLHTDLDRSGMRKAIRVFGEKLRRADTGLFYYAGHGIQINGRNYLVPLKNDVSSADEVQDESIDASAVLRKMEAAGNKTNIVILDACRNNPFARSFRSLEQGLARMDGPEGSFIAYATSPGSVAADGKGRNGMYTKYLLEALNKPGISIEQTFKWVRNAVKNATDGKQIPWESSSLMGEFVFRADRQNASFENSVPVVPIISKKYLQIITNVPNAKVIINQKDRGITDSNGVLNIENILDDEVEVLIDAKGFNPERKIVSLVPNKWEKINIAMIPTAKTPGTNPANAGIDTKACMRNKRVLVSSKIEYSQVNGKTIVKRNAPEFNTLVRQALEPYGLRFVDEVLSSQQLYYDEKYQDELSQAVSQSKAQYLIRFSSSVQETPIKTIKTNMNTVEGDLTLEWIDLTSKDIMGSITDSFREAGLDGRSILRKAELKNLNRLAKKIISQVCQ